MNDMTHRPSIEAPQLRTLLLTDLCDSTTLIERIGDVEAATLFRDHDLVTGTAQVAADHLAEELRVIHQ